MIFDSIIVVISAYSKGCVADNIPMRYGVMIFLGIFLLFLVLTEVSGQDLSITSQDLRIDQTIEGGYYLYVRKKPGVNSVLLTESTADPAFKLASYALRNPSYHPENGDELRILDGEILRSEDLYSLIDSTTVSDAQFGQAFKIFIPYIVEYGYEADRNGEIQVLDGTYLSVRAFALPYADYRGDYADNPFIMSVTQRPSPSRETVVIGESGEGTENEEERIEPDFTKYMADTVSSFSNIAEVTEGKTLFSDGEEDLLYQIEEILSQERGKQLDLVIVLDSTESMENHMSLLRENLDRVIEENTEVFQEVRIGFVYYRDYLEEYLYRIRRFESGVGRISSILNRITPRGGRDIPEAVNEALYAAITKFGWIGDNRKIILIGDAPPHPRPRGNVTANMVEKEAKAKDIGVHVIILPH